MDSTDFLRSLGRADALVRKIRRGRTEDGRTFAALLLTGRAGWLYAYGDKKLLVTDDLVGKQVGVAYERNGPPSRPRTLYSLDWIIEQLYCSVSGCKRLAMRLNWTEAKPLCAKHWGDPVLRDAAVGEQRDDDPARPNASVISLDERRRH